MFVHGRPGHPRGRRPPTRRARTGQPDCQLAADAIPGVFESATATSGDPTSPRRHHLHRRSTDRAILAMGSRRSRGSTELAHRLDPAPAGRRPRARGYRLVARADGRLRLKTIGDGICSTTARHRSLLHRRRPGGVGKRGRPPQTGVRLSSVPSCRDGDVIGPRGQPTRVSSAAADGGQVLVDEGLRRRPSARRVVGARPRRGSPRNFATPTPSSPRPVRRPDAPARISAAGASRTAGGGAPTDAADRPGLFLRAHYDDHSDRGSSR